MGKEFKNELQKEQVREKVPKLPEVQQKVAFLLPCHSEKMRRLQKGHLQWRCRWKWGVYVFPECAWCPTFDFRFLKVVQHGWRETKLREGLIKNHTVQIKNNSICTAVKKEKGKATINSWVVMRCSIFWYEKKSSSLQYM